MDKSEALQAVREFLDGSKDHVVDRVDTFLYPSSDNRQAMIYLKPREKTLGEKIVKAIFIKSDAPGDDEDWFEIRNGVGNDAWHCKAPGALGEDVISGLKNTLPSLIDKIISENS